jgi:hypothetical protein
MTTDVYRRLAEVEFALSDTADRVYELAKDIEQGRFVEGTELEELEQAYERGKKSSLAEITKLKEELAEKEAEISLVRRFIRSYKETCYPVDKDLNLFSGDW